MRALWIHLQLLLLLAMLNASVFHGSALAGSSRIDGLPDSDLRSAFLGTQQWGTQLLSRAESDMQLRKHFAVVHSILEKQTDTSLRIALERAENLSGQQWTATDRAAFFSNLAVQRKRQMATLAFYSARGRFPQNEGHSEHEVPIFVDDHKTHCAVGYLMHRSGWDASVAEIVRANNLVYVSDVEEGPLLSWVLQSGLTQEEAALIQPAYVDPSTPLHAESSFWVLETPGADVSCCGVTVSDVEHTHFHFDADVNLPDQAFQSARNLVDTQGTSNIIFNLTDALAVGDSEHNGFLTNYGNVVPLWQNNLDDWVTTRGHNSGNVNYGHNTSVTKTQFAVRLDQPTLAIGVTSPRISGEVSTQAQSGGHVIVLTEVRSPSGNLIGTGELRFDENTLGDLGYRSPLIPVNDDEFIVTTYGVAIGNAVFANVAVEFSQVPEPATNWLGLIVACVLIRSRRVRGYY